MIDLVIVAIASGLAGFVDAVVGGGGLVLVPALFATYPAAVPATLFGTNKGGRRFDVRGNESGVAAFG